MVQMHAGELVNFCPQFQQYLLICVVHATAIYQCAAHYDRWQVCLHSSQTYWSPFFHSPGAGIRNPLWPSTAGINCGKMPTGCRLSIKLSWELVKGARQQIVITVYEERFHQIVINWLKVITREGVGTGAERKWWENAGKRAHNGFAPGFTRMYSVDRINLIDGSLWSVLKKYEMRNVVNGVQVFPLEGRLQNHLKVGKRRSPNPIYSAAQGAAPYVPAMGGGASKSGTLAARTLAMYPR